MSLTHITHKQKFQIFHRKLVNLVFAVFAD